MNATSHLNPASSKTRRNMQSTSKRQMKLSQSVDQQHYTSLNIILIKKDESSEIQALKDTVFRMAMEITELKSANDKLQVELKQTQHMQEYYLKELEERKDHILKLQDIITLSKLPHCSVDIPIEIGLRSQQQETQSQHNLSISMMKPSSEVFPSRLQILKKKFQNKQNAWEGQHKRIRSEAKRQR